MILLVLIVKYIIILNYSGLMKNINIFITYLTKYITIGSEYYFNNLNIYIPINPFKYS